MSGNDVSRQPTGVPLVARAERDSSVEISLASHSSGAAMLARSVEPTSVLRRLREAAHPLHRLRRSRLLSRHVFPRLDITLRTRLPGVNWPIYVRLMRNFSYVVGKRLLEPGTTALMDVILARCRPRVFWDVGANVGFYSWVFLSYVPDGQALLLEPEPDNLALLKRTIKNAGLTGATCLPVAATDAVGHESFSRDPVSGATGGLATNAAPFITRHYGFEAPTISVPTTTLDDLARDHPPPQLVKIDVEGSELAVLRGADALLREYAPVVLFELSASNRSAVLALFEARGYQVHPSSAPDANEVGAREDEVPEVADFIALPPSLIESWPELRQEWHRKLGCLPTGARHQGG